MILQGELRIGKQFPSDRFTDGGSAANYYHPKCWFEVFLSFAIFTFLNVIAGTEKDKEINKESRK